MARTDTLNNYLTDISTVIKQKRNITDNIQAKDFDKEIQKIESGGLEINGIIEEYKANAGENINVGDFVGFVNFKNNTDVKLSNSEYAGRAISAVALSNNKVFIAHSSGSYVYLYGMICTISENTIIVETDMLLSENCAEGQGISAVVLSSNKVFVAYGDRSSCYLHGIVCIISGTKITTGTDTTLNSNMGSGKPVSVVALDSNKVFIAYSYSSYLCGMVCTISGTTITSGVDTKLIYNVGSMSIAALNNSKVFFTNSDSNSHRLYGMICTISGTTITGGTNTQLSTVSWTGDYTSTVALDSSKVFITHGCGNGGICLYGIVCMINEGIITRGIDTQLSTAENTGNVISTAVLDSNKVFITYGYGGAYLYGMVCIISETEIIRRVDIELNTNQYPSPIIVSIIALDNNKVFIGYSYRDSYYLYRMMIRTDLIKQIKGIQNAICGIAKTSGTGGQNIQVYTPLLV